MKEIFLKNKILIFRTLGSLMLIVGFAIYFWTTPKEALTQNEIAAANVARMEASVLRGSSSTTVSKPSSTKFLKEFKEAQKKQVRYFVILTMIFGAGFLVYSFIKPNRDKKTKLDSEQ
ncbi:hypothetical protein [Sulfurimonas sp.]|uniref:hypothetical protein n=1 Tax=Sulfurimonas sp. TaxID=2022749 RepID=UPI00262948F4|nr:hypothetical protein [Sulfurimonas sp.]MCW8894717.1 hypothetical protein [Sulfurimonas sp.]